MFILKGPWEVCSHLGPGAISPVTIWGLRGEPGQLCWTRLHPGYPSALNKRRLAPSFCSLSSPVINTFSLFSRTDWQTFEYIMFIFLWPFFFPQEKISALKKQANHIVQQAQREQDHFVKEKNNLIMMLQRVSISFSELVVVKHRFQLRESCFRQDKCLVRNTSELQFKEDFSTYIFTQSFTVVISWWSVND